MPDKAYANAAHDSKQSSTVSRKKGINALYVPVMEPNGSEVSLQFQWMRPHPLSLIAMSDAMEVVNQDTRKASKAALNASRLFPQYRKAVVMNNETKGEAPNVSKSNIDSSTLDVSSDSFFSPFLQVSEIKVELVDLIEPPLLSTSIPRFLEDEEEEESVKRPYLEEFNFVSSLPDRAREVLDNLSVSVFTEIESNYAIECSDCQIDFLSSLCLSELGTTFPSLVLHEFWKNKYAERAERQLVTGTAAEFFLVNLVLLAKFGASEDLGRHILQSVAPPVLMECNDLVTNPTLAHVGTRLFQRLAQALVLNCSLGRLAKRELLNLMPLLDGTSDALRELFCCIGEAYSAAKKR